MDAIVGKKPSIRTSKAAPATKKEERVVIAPMNFKEAVVDLDLTSYVSNNFSHRKMTAMMEKQMEGEAGKKRKKREPKDFDRDYLETLHYSREGWVGIPASSFRNAMISACKIVGWPMTKAKLSLFVIPDGLDREDGQPLVKINGKHRRFDKSVRIGIGQTDILPRAIFDTATVKLRLEWDADQFTTNDVINLLARAGKQVGIGAGRPDSRTSNGMGWGTFTVRGAKQA